MVWEHGLVQAWPITGLAAAPGERPLQYLARYRVVPAQVLTGTEPDKWPTNPRATQHLTWDFLSPCSGTTRSAWRRLRSWAASTRSWGGSPTDSGWIGNSSGSSRR